MFWTCVNKKQVYSKAMDRLDSKYEDKTFPLINLKTRITQGAPRLPEELADINQGRIADLLPGEWGIGQVNSVLRTYDREESRGVFFVDTHDSVQTRDVTRRDFETRPALMRIEMDETARSFVADMRHVRHILYKRIANLAPEYGPLEEAEWFCDRARAFGSQVLKGIVLRSPEGEPATLVTDGAPTQEFIEEVARLCTEVDVHYAYSRRAQSVKLPIELYSARYYERSALRPPQN